MTLREAYALPHGTRVRMTAYGRKTWKPARGPMCVTTGETLGMRNGMLTVHQDGHQRQKSWNPVYWERDEGGAS